MRFLHLSDLHLGKRLCEFSMLEEQRYILEEILTLLDETPVDGVLLAGDLYDKPVPPAEAVRLLGLQLEFTRGDAGLIPKTGGLLVIANHPFGIAEGMATGQPPRRATAHPGTVAGGIGHGTAAKARLAARIIVGRSQSPPPDARPGTRLFAAGDLVLDGGLGREPVGD